MIGIRFCTHMHARLFLEKVLSIEPFNKYTWAVGWYISLQDVPGLPTGIFPVSKLQANLQKLTYEETAEFYCLFGTVDSSTRLLKLPETVPEYLNSKCCAILMCTDICEFNLYCKDEEALTRFRERLVTDGICESNKIEYFDAETDRNPGFYW